LWRIEEVPVHLEDFSIERSAALSKLVAFAPGATENSWAINSLANNEFDVFEYFGSDKMIERNARSPYRY